MKKYLAILLLFEAFLASPRGAQAHCDGLDGPVVKAAQKALETGNVNLVLVWVQKKDEGEITKAFQKTLAVRKLNSQAKELADLYFFETLVRIHRAGEGDPYMGLQPAGHDVGLAIPAADKALESSSAKSLTDLLTDAARDGIRDRFEEVTAKRKFRADDVEAGRQYVRTYVEFIHYVERIYDAAKSPAEGHYPEPQRTAGPKK